MKKLKKYRKLIPLILYPYAYLLVILFYISIVYPISSSGYKEFNNAMDMVVRVIGVIYNVYVVGFCVFHSVLIVRREVPARDAAWMNLIVKVAHIPAYCFHFIMMSFGALMSVWGIGFVMLALIVNVLTIALSGICAIGCAVRMKKEGLLSTGKAVCSQIGSFIIGIDIVVAIVYIIVSRRKAYV